MLIGLIGRKRAGKDTACEVLEGLANVQKIAYAGKLKEIAKDLFDLSDDQVNGSTASKEAVDPRWGLSGRKILQLLGTEVTRHIHKETWIRYAMREVDQAVYRGYVTVVTDVRFANEAEAIKNRGGWLVRVIRTSPLGEDLHASEVEQDRIKVDLTIDNTGTLEEFHKKVERAFEILQELEIERILPDPGN